MFLCKYKDIEIYVSEDGTFYCNVETNSKEEYQATYKAKTLRELKDAINEVDTTITPFEVYYLQFGNLSKVMVKGKAAGRYIADGKFIDTEQSCYFPLDIENSKLFPYLLAHCKAYNQLDENITKMIDEKSSLLKKIEDIKRLLPRFS